MESPEEARDRHCADVEFSGVFPVAVELPALDSGDAMEAHTKRTYQPGILRRKRRHGFRHRTSTVGGRRVINNRRHTGRWKISA